ncbi:MAG: hypothetical protein ACR2JJ_06485 [Sphingomicrobium sp.]
MRQTLVLAIAATFFATPAPVLAQAASFTIVNNTDIDFTNVMVRRFGTEQWRPMVIAPVPVARSGGRGAADFTDPDCAFDLQATLPDGRLVVWPAVNLCDAKVVTLNRSARGDLWVDYR